MSVGRAGRRRAAGGRAARLLLLLGLAVPSSACVLGRVGPALGHSGEAERARALLEQIGLPGREIHEDASQYCGVYNRKYFDEFSCSSSVAKYAVVRGSLVPVWAELDERLVLGGWTAVGAHAYTKREFGGTLGLMFGESVLNIRQPDATRALLEQALASLGPDESLLGARLVYSTPSDVLRSYTCWFGC
jgi:hypothetical protein